MGHLYYFVAFMFARVPSWLEHLDGMYADVHKKEQIEFARDRERFYKHCAEIERERGKPFGTDYEGMRQNVLSGKFNIEQTSKAFNLGSMFKSAQTAADLLSQFSYEVLHAPTGSSFVTSDSPVYTIQHQHRGGTAVVGVGFGLPRVWAYFPLNKRACLVLEKQSTPPVTKEIVVGHVEEINHYSMANATRYLYASSRYRRTSRLFNQWGCNIKPGKNAYMQSSGELRQLP
jgi:hypothetical protein